MGDIHPCLLLNTNCSFAIETRQAALQLHFTLIVLNGPYVMMLTCILIYHSLVFELV